MSGVSGVSRRRVLTLAPLGVAAAAGVGFWGMLAGMRQGSFDPRDIHTPAQGRPVPDFALPDQAPGRGFDAQALRAATAPVLVNFFASWCIPCVVEAPVLAAVGGQLPIWGIAYKDAAADAAGFVGRSGAAFARLAADLNGLTAIDWGVSGVPESFLIRPGGVIAWHLPGALTQEIVDGTLLPLAAGLRR